MTQEALKLALDFVETVHVGEWVGSIERQLEVITAIKEALAQTQEPVKMVAYNCFCGRTMKFESVHGVVAPQRTFVGLTDEEIAQGCKESWVTEQAWQSAVWWAEDKLKQKNGYAEENA